MAAQILFLFRWQNASRTGRIACRMCIRYEMVNIQAYVNMAAALLVFIGGIVVVCVFPSRLAVGYRVLIGLAVAGYFVLRMRQAFAMLRRDRQGSGLGLPKDDDGDEIDNPKTP